jgi:hypothetical protein
MHARFTLTHPGARTFTFIAVAGAGLLLSLPASAELSPALDRASISVGAFLADPTFNASLNTPYGRLQSGDISLGEEAMPRIKADIILFDSQGLSLDYYQYKRGYSGAFANNKNFGGTEVTTVGNANFDVKLDFGKLAYKWWFGSGNTVVGVGAGAAYFKISTNANATAALNNNSASVSDSYSDDAVAPLLEVGVRHAISPDFRLFADASGVKKTGGTLNGEIYNAAVGVEWFPAKNVGVVLDYSMNQIDLRRDDGLAENFKVKFQGPSASVKVRF